MRGWRKVAPPRPRPDKALPWTAAAIWESACGRWRAWRFGADEWRAYGADVRSPFAAADSEAVFRPPVARAPTLAALLVELHAGHCDECGARHGHERRSPCDRCAGRLCAACCRARRPAA